MTIREAISLYSDYKSKCIKRNISYLVNNTSLCMIIPLNNGVRIFIDTHPEIEEIRKKYPLEMPNKNNVFKRISFEISDDEEPVLPESIKKYTGESPCNGVLYYVDTAKERAINEFINANGGIDENLYKRYQEEIWLTK